MVWFEQVESMNQKDYNRLELLFWKSYAKENPNLMIEKLKTNIVNSEFIIYEHFNEKFGIHFYYLINRSFKDFIKQIYEVRIEGYDTPNDLRKLTSL